MDNKFSSRASTTDCLVLPDDGRPYRWVLAANVKGAVREWVVTPEVNHVEALDLLGWPGDSRGRLNKTADHQRRLSHWRSQVTGEKLARAEELAPQARRQWWQVDGPFAVCGETLETLQVDVLLRFAALWAKQNSGSIALGRYATRIQTSCTDYTRWPTKLEKLYGHLEKTNRDRAEQIGCALNTDGKAQCELNHRPLRKFADELLRILETYPGEKLLHEDNKDDV